MNKQQEQIKHFMLEANQVCPDKPTVPSNKILDLRIALINEEFCEYVDAVKSGHCDLVEVADAIADLLYVVIGTAVAHGIKIEPVFNEVHRSNMTKFIDGTFREDGKYIKGPSFSKPDIKRIIDEQLTEPSVPSPD